MLSAAVGAAVPLEAKVHPVLSVVNLGAPLISAFALVLFPCPLPSAARSALRSRLGFVG